MGEVNGQSHFCRVTWGHLSLAELMSCQCRQGCGCSQGRAGRGTDGSPSPFLPPSWGISQAGSRLCLEVQGARPSGGELPGRKGPPFVPMGHRCNRIPPHPAPKLSLSRDLHSKVASFIQSCLLLRDFL